MKIEIPVSVVSRFCPDGENIRVKSPFQMTIDRKNGSLKTIGNCRVRGPFMVKKDSRWLAPEDLTPIDYRWELRPVISLEIDYLERVTLRLEFHDSKIIGELSGDFELCRFPYIGGLKAEDDELVTPNNFGEIIPDPVNTMKRPVEWASCKWHNYRVDRPVEGVPGCVHTGEKSVYRLNYCGGASMTWLDYGKEGGRYYIASYDERFPTTTLHIEATDDITIAIEKIGGENSSTGPCEFSFHSGTWHESARKYRAWAETWYKPGKTPDWVYTENGLLVHYDFKFQNGEIHHRFEDIPELFDSAQKSGFKHLYVSAWNEGGFDTLYPQFYPDLDLGTVRDLKKAVEEVKRAGGKLSLYINARIFNKRSEFYRSIGKTLSAKDESGNEYTENYGKESFICMCAAEKRWDKMIRDFVLWATEDLGVTGVYVDQIGVSPRLCFDPDHSHTRSDEWNGGYVDLLRGIQEESSTEPFVIMEGCGDIYSQYVGAQLVHAGWGLYTPYGHPEIYKYVFPEVLHIDMVHPKPVPIDTGALGLEPLEVVYRSFILGTHYWVYDHVIENEDLWGSLKEVFRLRTLIQDDLRKLRFVDDEKIKTEGVKRFTSESGELIVFYNEADHEHIDTSLDLPEEVEALYLGEEPEIISTRKGLPIKGRLLGAFRWRKS